jgi:hypothetical protein
MFSDVERQLFFFFCTLCLGHLKWNTQGKRKENNILDNIRLLLFVLKFRYDAIIFKQEQKNYMILKVQNDVMNNLRVNML